MSTAMSKLLALSIALMLIGAFFWIRAQQVLDDYQAQRDAVGGLGGVVIDLTDALDTGVDIDEEISNRQTARNVGIAMVVSGASLSVFALGKRSNRPPNA